MASITQTVNNYIGGISQQPDEKKLPGQVVKANNVLPDITQGLLKRPGGRLVASLSDNGTASLNSVTNGKWFHYYRDETEQYIGQISRSDGTVRIWDRDGNAKTVNHQGNVKTYLTHSDDQDLQTLTLNDYTYVTNRTKVTAMAATVETVRDPEAFVELKQIKYASQYGLELYDNTNTTTLTTATRLSLSWSEDDGGASNSVWTGGECKSVGTQLFYKTHPSNSAKKNLVYRITATGQPVTGGGQANPTYYCTYNIDYELLYGGEGWVTNDSINQPNSRMTASKHDTDYTVTIADHSTSVVKANLALVRPTPTPFEANQTITADSILGDIKTEIDGNSITNMTVTQIGNGLHITRPTANGTFNVSTQNTNLLNVMSDSVQDVSDLPLQCKHGYVLKVRNGAAEEDDYYVKFFGNNDRDGEGTWEECPQPGRKITFDPDTMPIQIVREANGTFTVKVITWENCLVGDTTTAPEPSFIGKTINKMVFWRNRLILLSDENVIMSQPGEFFNFWYKSAITNTAVDTIDISCSSEHPAVLYDGIQTNSGLVLFSKNQQFLLTTDSDVLSPTTAKINSLSDYNFNHNTSPVSLGTTIGFLDNAGRYTRFWELSSVLREGEPNVVDQTKVVDKLFDKDLVKISNSRENGLIFFSKKGEATLYGFRYLTSGQQRLQQAWFTWDLPGNIQHHAILDDTLYVVLRNGSKDCMLRFDIKIDTDSRTITDDKDTVDTADDLLYRVHLDNSKVIASSALGYSTTTKRTGFTKPDGYEASTKQLAVFCHPTGDDVGRYAEASIVGSNIEFDGDWTGKDLTVGYLYDYEVEFPTIFKVQANQEQSIADMTASLIIHRMKLHFGANGLYETTLKRKGKPDYSELWEPPLANLYSSNAVPITEEATRSIPVYERNKNVNVTLKSTHPTPATLYSMSWEGDYTTNYYRRV